MESAQENFLPDHHCHFAILDGVEGFPVGTECRHGIFHRWLRDRLWDWAFLVDADMLVTEPVRAEEIIPGRPGIVATLHPGYIGMPRLMLPYENNADSCAYMSPHAGDFYYCGGFVGGSRAEILALSYQIDAMIFRDRHAGVETRWHDESCLNFRLAVDRPVLTLDPGFCHPANDEYYVRGVWGGETYPRKITAIDKTPAQRVGR